MTKLPEWLEAELPEMRPVNYIDYDPMTQLFTYKDKEFDTIVEAYDSSSSDDAIDFTDDAKKAADGNDLEGMHFNPNGRLLLANTDERDRWMLEYEYKVFLKWDAEYQNNPDDWAVAYSWIQQHPAFWIKDSYFIKKNPNGGKTFDWNTSNGIDDLWTCVAFNEGKPVVMLEGGGHVEEGYTMCYHDYRLDVWAPNFEDAYVQYAKLVNKFFNPDGSEKPRLDSDDEV